MTEGSEIEQKLTKYSLGSRKRYGYAAKERIFFSGREKNRSHSGAMARIFDKAQWKNNSFGSFRHTSAATCRRSAA